MPVKTFSETSPVGRNKETEEDGKWKIENGKNVGVCVCVTHTHTHTQTI